MKTLKIFLILLFCFFSLKNTFSAESYQRWVYWGEYGHIASLDEATEILNRIGNGEIKPNVTYTASSGEKFRIPNPDLYLQYHMRCIKAIDSTIKTVEDAVASMEKGEVVKWGDDIHYKVRNYYFSYKYNKVVFIDNYTGAPIGVPVLLINSKPVVKLNCLNPLEVINDNTPSGDIVIREATSIFEDKRKEDTIIVNLSINIPRDTIINLINLNLPKQEPTGPVSIKDGKIRWWHIVVPTIVIAGSIFGGFMYLANKKRDIIIPTTPSEGGPSGVPTHDDGGDTSSEGEPSGSSTHDDGGGNTSDGGPSAVPTGD